MGSPLRDPWVAALVLVMGSACQTPDAGLASDVRALRTEIAALASPTPPPTSAAATPTQVITIQAPQTWDQTVSGSCFGPSSVLSRPDAFRCTSGNEIRDPCFTVAAVRAAVLCPPSPPQSAPVLRLNLTGALPALSPSASAAGVQPWVVELENGQVCALVTGATRTVGTKRLNYACPNGEWVLGFTRGPVWTAELTAPVNQWPARDDPGPLLNRAVRSVWQ